MQETIQTEEGRLEDLKISGKIIKSFGSFLSGLIALFLFSTFVLLSSPIYFYRFILAQFIVPLFFHQKIGKPVTSTGNIFATEFLNNHQRSPRCAIVTNFVLEGSLSDEEIVETIERRWINNKEQSNGMLVYPEFQQYVESWMGFMFWKLDKSFSLRNHLRFHEIQGRNDDHSERFVCNLIENLLNEPFPRKRSPWEVHVIRNYSNSQLQSQLKNNNRDNGDDVEVDGGSMTFFILRFHHTLADGFSILYAVIEGLFEMPLSEISLPSASSPSTSAPISPHESGSVMGNIASYFMLALRMIQDFGYCAILASRPTTPLHVPDRKKKWRQVYARSEHIPIKDLKEIKTKLGVSFTGVLLSSISAGVAKTLQSKKTKNGKQIDTMAALIPLPLAGHPMKLRNHVTGTIFDLPVGPGLSPFDRLLKCERNLQSAKLSTLPWLAVMYAKLVGSHFAPIARILLHNAVIPMGLSSFPGPGREVVWKGRKGLAGDFVAGAVQGVAGVGFMVLSYGNFIRIAASAENAIMEREDLKDLIDFIEEEIDTLRFIDPGKMSDSSSSFKKKNY